MHFLLCFELLRLVCNVVKVDAVQSSLAYRAGAVLMPPVMDAFLAVLMTTDGKHAVFERTLADDADSWSFRSSFITKMHQEAMLGSELGK